MAVNFVSSAAAGDSNLDNTTTFASVNAGAGDFLLVLAVLRASFTGNIVNGVTFGLANLVEAFQFNPFVSPDPTTAIAAFYLVAPSGIHTITVNFAATTSQKDAAYYVLSGVDQATPLGVVFTEHLPSGGTQIGDTISNSQVGGLVVDCVGLAGDRASSMAVNTAEQTFRHAVNTTSTTLATSTKPGAPTVEMSWQWNPTSAFRNYAMIPINPAAADHRRLIIGGLARGGTLIDTATTQDSAFLSTINSAGTIASGGAVNASAEAGHRVISAVETLDYNPTLSVARPWIAGIAAYKADTTGGGTTPVPEITSALIAEITEGALFSYEILATNAPFDYSASPLPAGVILDTELGQITGHPNPGTADTYNVVLGATNETGTGNATLVLTVHPIPATPPAGTFKVKPLPVAVRLALSNMPQGIGSGGQE